MEPWEIGLIYFFSRIILMDVGGEVVKDVCASPFQKIRVLIVVEDHVNFERDFELLVKM